ncbi:WGR domain-containing protein [Acidisoma sp. L85]|uniref:WGR domain-containing protein n=1 Tax=Acidisoma sp. L85 TaxID=1641850 RepID=UPI00352A2DA4
MATRGANRKKLQPVQLPLFPDSAASCRIRPDLNEWRYYRMEVWPDLFGRALLMRQWGRIGTNGASGWTRILIPELLSIPWPGLHDQSTEEVIGRGRRRLSCAARTGRYFLNAAGTC